MRSRAADPTATSTARRAVPKPAARSVSGNRRAHDPRHQGWNLRWRPSDRVQRASGGVAHASGGVERTAYQTESRPARDYFADPFGDSPVPRDVQQPSAEGAGLEIPEPRGEREGPSLGSLIRASAQQDDQPQEPAGQQPSSVEELLPPPGNASNGGGRRPESDEVAQESPSDRPRRRLDPSPGFGSPYESIPPADGPDRQRRDELAPDRTVPDRGNGGPQFRLDDLPTGRVAFTCEEFRQRIAEQDIRKISLDISPPFRPDVINQADWEQLKADFEADQPIRQWRTADGKPLASGRLIDLAYERAVIETDYGAEEELPINRLSEADLAYISESWGLPKECLIEQVDYTPRSWTHLAMTWKASNLCHHPLYFEQVNLERYGHTAGPILQPVVSSAHFFANIAVLPYKMGIHPPHECRYALGYYRPGDCAPWIVPPVPLSLRGGLSQAATMTGLFWLVP
jgi:hypothetical protein